jgi:DNA polymerase III delta prime subunit
MTEANWAEEPINIIQAAKALGISRSSLDYALKDARIEANVHFELRGNRKLFYSNNILKLREVLTECALKPHNVSAKMEFGMLRGVHPMAGASDTLLKLKILALQKKNAPT